VKWRREARLHADSFIHGATPDDKPKSVVSIHVSRDRGHLAKLHLRSWVDQAEAYAVDVVDQPDNAVGFHAAQISFYQAFRNNSGIVIIGPGPFEQFCRKFCEVSCPDVGFSGRPCRLRALRKNRLAAVKLRLSLNQNSTVSPLLSTADRQVRAPLDQITLVRLEAAQRSQT